MTDRNARGEPTVPDPDHMETRDLRGAAAREARPTPNLREAPEVEAPLVNIGRYQPLGVVGTGGMGTVLGAWDPELERRVALKLVRFASPDARERMLREGQLLARLSHPNVVPVFDVDVAGDQVYLVMEWVSGSTLRDYAKTADARAVLAAYRQAGEGLAAAHRAGVVHRDFKPDNAIIGDDDRVRVLDFGIAQGEAGARVAVHGTPRYMAPEQNSGDAVDAAADQYAFCVSLREALELHGSVPSWIAAIIERGCDEFPDRRYRSMTELLAALARDPARRRRRVTLGAALGVVLVGFAIGAFAIGQSRAARKAVEPCSGVDAELAASWNPTVRAAISANLAQLGPLADPVRTLRELDDYGAKWVVAERNTCLANEAKQLTPSIYEGRQQCLARGRSALAAVAELLAGVKTDNLGKGLIAVGVLPAIEGCADDVGIEPPRPEIRDRVQEILARMQRARVLAVAMSPEAVPTAEAAVADARATGYAPLIARARLDEGHVKAQVGAEGDTAAIFWDAMLLGLAAHDDVTAVEAYARWIYAHDDKWDGPFENWDVINTIAERLGRPGRFAHAWLYNNRGVTYLVHSEWDKAREMFERADAVAGDAREPELQSIPRHLAALSDPDTATPLLRRARDRLADKFGPDHYGVLDVQVEIGLSLRDPVAALAEVGGACPGLQRWKVRTAGFCAYEAGLLADEAGDQATARSWFQQVSGTGPFDKIAAAYLAITADPPDPSALASLKDLLAPAPDASYGKRLMAADSLVVMAKVDPTAWPRALALFETLPQPIFAQRLARARSEVAAQLAATKPEEARRLRELARAFFPTYGW